MARAVDGKTSSLKRLWYDEIYLHGYDTASKARQGLSRYLDFYNPTPALDA